MSLWILGELTVIQSDTSLVLWKNTKLRLIKGFIHRRATFVRPIERLMNGVLSALAHSPGTKPPL